MIIELHILQNFAPSCLNRDDTGAPKECEFGGYRRARISSQCIKRAIRDYFRDSQLFSEEDLAKRTLLTADELVRRLKTLGKPEGEARDLVRKVLLNCKLNTDDKGKTEYLLFLGEREISNLAREIAVNWDVLQKEKNSQEASEELKRIAERILNVVLDGGKAVDLALFGRMIAGLPEKNIDAACQVAHALSTNKLTLEFDYFTAVDDLQPQEEPGAGMIGTIEFDSACYYRYANVDLRQLKKNLQDDDQLACQAWQAFIKATVNAVPTGRQNSMSAHNPPDFVFAVAREYGTWSLSNAFLKPISPTKSKDVMERSAEALLDYWNRLIKAYGNDGIKATPVLSLVEIPPDGWHKVQNLDELLETLAQAVSQQPRG